MKNHMITLDELLSCWPGEEYGRDRLLEITGGRTEMTASEILGLNMPATDRLEIVFCPDVLGFRLVRLAECAFIEHVLPLWYKAYPEDDRIRRAIDVARLYSKGEASIQELDAAHADVCVSDGKNPPLVEIEDASTGWSASESAWLVLQAADHLTEIYLTLLNYYISSTCFSAVLADRIGQVLKRDGLNWHTSSNDEVNRVWDEAEADSQSEFEWQAETLREMIRGEER